MAALNGAEWDAVSPRVDAVLVLYDHDGKTPKRRQFKTLDEGVVAFDRLQQFHAALRVKHRAPPNAEVMVLFARASRRSDVWYAARSSGAGVAAVALENWVGLRRLARFEAGSSRVVALVGGCLLRALLWAFVQRKPATAATPRPWPPWVVRLLSLGLEFFWPTIRATINNSVNVLVLPIANAAIARMENRAIDKLTKLELDIGSEAPTLTSVAVTPSLTGYDFVDVDVGVLYHGYRVRLDMEANLGGDELPDVEGQVSRFGVEGALRLKFGPLTTGLPCASLLRYGFLRKPTLTINSEFGVHEAVTALPVGISLGAIDRFIQRLLDDVIAARLCWPARATVDLATLFLGPDRALDVLPEESARDASHPIGQLRVEIASCASLLNNDVGGKSDPYVVCTLGATKRTTTTIHDDCDPAWEHPATFLFDVHESSQELHVAVFDSEDDNFNTFADALLGVVAVPMSALYDAGDGTGPVELTLPLDCSVYDGKLKAYHATRTPEPSFVTLRAMLDLDDEPDRGAAGARAAKLAGAAAGATFVALTYAATTAALHRSALEALALLQLHLLNAAVAAAVFALALGALL